MAEDIDHDMLNAMLKAGTIGLGMELIKLPDETRPTIKPMSEIAGSLAMLEAVKYGLVDRGGSGSMFRKAYIKRGLHPLNLSKCWIPPIVELLE